MAGQFELYIDEASEVRFRMIGPDGTVLAVSRSFPDTKAAAAGIAAMRECAGTGLISNLAQGVRESQGVREGQALRQAPGTRQAANAPAAGSAVAPAVAAQRAHRKGLCAA
ncbi:hypothetical protein [Arthrobacter sp. ISL-72]|uniref:hypothetical protein n=1 Tax=Arthrobacter sp. ISL-72 TaxID=2819114 RepID=UPI001BEAB8B4|nr:hypothetical protein [Arthrobacter sp. ISL-72]MBT2597324.1 hypothetical protein [Arthrobacter sp. ISL-72]